MIINSIILENIRSYSRPEPIELTTGVTLFEGDIGSGKSTILSAIEFALFGLGDITGEYLLRHGAKKGSVSLKFSVSGKEYQAFRSIERNRKSVTQKIGYIIEEGTKTEYGVKEMKARILAILKFNESPQPKTSSLIYRYAIFTPQEMMKEVLSQKVENRLNTLRRAFRIEDYNTIANNASILSYWLEKRSEILNEQVKDLSENYDQLSSQVDLKSENEKNLEELNSELKILAEERLSLDKEIEQNQAEKEEVQTLEKIVPLLKEGLNRDVGNLKELNKHKVDLNNELEEVGVAEKALEDIKPLYQEYADKNQRLEELEPSIKQLQELNNQKIILTNSIENSKKAIEKENENITKELARITKNVKKQESLTEKMPELQALETQLTAEVSAAPNYSELVVSITKQNSVAAQDAIGRRDRVSTLEAELKEIQSIGIGAQCPKCKQQLTQQHYGKVEQGYLKEITELKQKIEELEKQAEETNKQLIDTKDKRDALKTSQDKLQEIKKEIAKLSGVKDALENYQNELHEKQTIYQTNEKMLTEGNYALSEKAQLTSVIENIGKLFPIEEEYNTTKTRIKALEKQKVKERYSANSEKISRRTSLTNDIAVTEEKITTLDKEIKDKQKSIAEKQNEYELKKPVLQTLATLETNKTLTQKAYEDKKGEVVAKQKDIERTTGEIKRIEAEIAHKEHQQFRRDELKQYSLWIDERFIPAVKQIERSVLASIHGDFNRLFQNWFDHLLETGDIAVRVDENFTPIIEQNGYMMDVDGLSGGEKTSVALAYRLALNVMVKQVCAMQSNLLILDEPTDGFSREQLFKLRDILNELKCEQVIAVSHEAELESCVDKIFKITKVNGESLIAIG